MTTNGSLLSIDRVERLAALGIRSFQISLDGPKHLHDATRVRANGRGTFDQIWANLIAIRDSTIDVDVLLRIHLTPDNVESIPGLVQQLREQLLSDRRFWFFLKPVEEMGGLNKSSGTVIPEDQREAIVDSVRHAVMGSAAHAPQTYKICYASRPNSLMIRSDGRIGKCTVALAQADNTIGRLHPDGSVEIDPAVLRVWLQGWETGDRNFLECPYAAMQAAATQATA
jgi:uncharacterized protein